MKRNILRSLLLCTTVFGTTILTFSSPSFAYAQEPVTSDSLYQRPEQSPQIEEDTEESRVIPVPKPPYRSWLAGWFSMSPSTRPAQLGHKHTTHLQPIPLAHLSVANPLKQPRGIESMVEGYNLDEELFQQIQSRYPRIFRETHTDLEAHRITAEKIAVASVAIEQTPSIQILDKDPLSGLRRFMAPRKYWTPGWNSVIQFSQNYISSNWHKGGSSNLNLYSRQFFKLDYKKEKLSWNNELEWRLSIFTSPSDTVGRYRIADDLIRLHSNLGIQAVKNLFYTLDAEIRTQAFNMREENKTLALSGPLSPIVATVGLGLKYVYNYKSSTHYGRKARFEVNLAPIAYDFRWTQRRDIDLARHGFKDGKTLYSAIGSMLRADLTWDFSQSLRWQSRFYYNTSYKRVETEWENALIFAFSKFFSTRVNLHLRFDDAASHGADLMSRIQVNQLLSFGFEMNI